jgi:hypothetical protein
VNQVSQDTQADAAGITQVLPRNPPHFGSSGGETAEFLDKLAPLTELGFFIGAGLHPAQSAFAEGVDFQGGRWTLHFFLNRSRQPKQVHDLRDAGS